MSDWIPIDKMLPAIGELVLCSVNDDGEHKVILTYFDNKEYWFNGIVTAWMPAPKPYENKK